MVYGLRRHRFSSIKTKYSDGVVFAEHGRQSKGCFSDATIRLISWLRLFVAKVGDKLPTKEEIYLPSCLTKADIYALASDDLSQGGVEHTCMKSTFYQIWQSQFPHVKIPKVRITFRWETSELTLPTFMCQGVIIEFCKCIIGLKCRYIHLMTMAMIYMRS